MIDYTILVPRCQAFYSKIFLYFPSSQFFPFGFPERCCAAPSPNADTKTRLPLAPHLRHSRTASLPPARKPQRGQTANSPCGTGRKGSTPSHRGRRRACPPLREMPTAGPRNASRSLHTSNTAAQQASRSLKSRSAGRQQTPLAVLAARGVLFHTEADGGLARRCAKCRPQVREVPTAGPRSASRLSLVI